MRALIQLNRELIQLVRAQIEQRNNCLIYYTL